MTHHVLFGFKVFLAIFVSIALTLAFFYIGFVAGYSTGLSDGAVNGWMAAKQAVDTTGFFPILATEQQNATILAGTVAAVSENGLLIEADNLNPHPLDVPTPKERSIVLTAETKILKRVEKSAEEQTEDFSVFQKAFTDLSSGLPVPPIAYTETAIALSDIKVGARITVEAAENIWSATSFTASKISLISSATE